MFLERQVVITEEQWEETVDNWVNRVMGESTIYDCGFCTATKGTGLDCGDCPADVEVCDGDVASWCERGRQIDVALRVLEWLYDFGKIARWC